MGTKPMFVTIVAGLSLLGCPPREAPSSASGDPAPTMTVAAPPPAPNPTGAPPSATAAASAAPSDGPLGADCSEPASAPSEPAWGTVLCGPDGHVVGVFGPGDGADPLPESARVLAKSDGEGRASSYVATVGDVLHVVMITCGNCRRIMGWTFVGRPDRMSDEQRLALQRFVGLDANVGPLVSTDAWAKQPLPKLTSN